MLTYRRTSLLESPAQTLVNTVNCVGVMGKGIAREFKQREPEMFAAYKKICDQKLLTPGKLWLWRGADAWTLNFPTKIHWKNPSKIEWIEWGLKKFVATYEAMGIKEISFPRLGCGNGGLDWDDVRPLMESYLSKLPIQIFIHDHTIDIGLPEHLEAVATKVRSEFSADLVFETFLESLHLAVDLSKTELTDIDGGLPIEASMTKDGDLRVSSGDQDWSFEKEDLWGVWISLQKGLLTKEKAGWTALESGRPLLSILSLLPGIRPIEIQGFSSAEPELALEYRAGHRGNAIAPTQTRGQLELSWH